MWVFSKDAEEGLEFFKQDLKNANTKHPNMKFGYLPLLRIIIVCAVAGASIYIGAWIVHFFIEW